LAGRAEQKPPARRRPGFSRRRLLQSAGAAGLGAGLGGGVGYLAGVEASESAKPGTGAVEFYGERQAGITTPAQDRLAFGAFDLVGDDVRQLRDLMREWSAAAARMVTGVAAGPVNDEPLAPPDDTGETSGLGPSRLTISFGFGPGIFERDGGDRLGLARQRPSALRTLPPLPAESLDPQRSGGDIAVQACADDPQVAFHALRNLTRIGRGAVVLRWSQLGFGRTSTTSRMQDTPRNLMGFKDGTNNIRAEDEPELRRWVWVGDEGPDWLRGGTIMVTRRIRMLLEVWDRASLADQELTIGRLKASGAPLGAEGEFDPVDLGARSGDEPTIPADAHGLFFICFQRDPLKQFARIQRSLAGDALNEYIVHTSSAVFALPPGARPGGYVGEGLLG
jgi:deferrochelatase/peroxidase EfeB